jgi:hypothetical protein
MGFFGDFLGFGGGGDNVSEVVNQTPKPVQLPDYPEAEGARKNWYDTLNKWQTQPGYGAIQPNWNDIWENARQRVQRYFMGGPEGPGLNAQVKANSARRGMSENPAGDAMLQRSGFQQGNTLQDIAVKMAMEEANLSESGRKTWLSSLMNLAQLKPQFAMGQQITRSTPQPSIGEGVGDIFGSFGANMAESGSTGFDWLDEILGMEGLDLSKIFADDMGAGGGASDIGDVSSIFGGGNGAGGGGLFGFVNDDQSFGENTKDVATDPQTYAQIAQIISMFCWVAAAVFPKGWNDPKTHQARYFIDKVGPKWFKDLYVKHGEKFAAFIGNKPILKAVIRPVFEVFAFFGKLANWEEPGVENGR